jgi:hypothetical protein
MEHHLLAFEKLYKKTVQQVYFLPERLFFFWLDFAL